MNNLKTLVEEELGAIITDGEMQKAEHRARRKLEWIISREGDAEGERLKPWYLVHLIAEEVYKYRLSAECLIQNSKIDRKSVV